MGELGLGHPGDVPGTNLSAGPALGMLHHDPSAPLEPEETISEKQFVARMLALLAVSVVFMQVLVSSFFHVWAGHTLLAAMLALLVLAVPLLAWKAWQFFPWAGILLFCLYILAFVTRIPVGTAYPRLTLHFMVGAAVLSFWLWLVRPHPGK